MIDAHTHTKYSFDGKSRAADMAARGEELGLEYLAFTDHCDLDYAHILKYKLIKQIKIDKYVEGVNALRERFPFLALGLECGYSELSEKDYVAKIPFKSFDYILNSVHTVDGLDTYTQAYFIGKSKEKAYTKYLLKVLKSLDCAYPYNTVSHLGFVRKKAPYRDAAVDAETFGDILDEILKRIIEKGKTLEINTNTRSNDFMPGAEIVERYYNLGGRDITFASDAHIFSRICDRYPEARDMAKNVGFKYWTVYKNRLPVRIPID